MSEFKGVRAFLMIPPSISRDKELLKKPKSIILMGEIISMLNVTGEFFMSNKKIAEHLRVSARQVNRYLDLLEKKKLIEREKVVSDKNGAILGRKIHAGSALMTCMSLGWRTECHEGTDTGVIPLVSQTSHKYNNLIDHDNRTSNSSSGKKEEDPIREQIYKKFFLIARKNDKLKGKATNPSLDEIKQLRSLLYQCNIETLQAIEGKFDVKMQWNMLSDPWAYLLKMLRDGVAIDKNWG